jgi:nicotinate phosphoribosyltransferase
VTGSGAPTAGLVYKLVAREGADGTLVGVAKKSADKISIGGRKWALRRRGPDGVAQAEVVGIGHHPVDDGDDRALLVRLVDHGEIVGAEPLATARARHAASVAELPATGRQLSRGEAAIPTLLEPDPVHAA